MANNTYYNEILTEHNIRPLHKYKMEGADFSLEGVNPSCGDDIVLYLKLDQDERRRTRIFVFPKFSFG